MSALPWDILLLVLLGGAVAGFVQGLTGFAFGLVAMAFWSWALPPAQGGALVVLCSILGQGMGVRRLSVGALPRAVPFILGGALGVPGGVLLLPMVNPLLFQAGLGAVLLVWCPLMLASGRLPRVTRGGFAADAVVGALGGVMGGLGGLPGPIPTLWCVLRGWERSTQRAVFQVVFLTMHLFTLAGYLAAGTVPPGVWPPFLALAPVVVGAALLGAQAFRSFGHIGFQRLVLGLLAGSGIALLVAAVPRLLAMR